MSKQFFSLEILNQQESCTAEIWDSTDPFGVPIASAVGVDANDAIAKLINKLDFRGDKEGSNA